jgi:hypothetical protein
MAFEQKSDAQGFGKVLGFVFSYVLFTTIMFYAFTFLEKVPASWSYLHFVGITLTIVVVSAVIRRGLV